jgi:hypothetical protein
MNEDNKANITFSNGIDRIISDFMHESDPQSVMFFPFVQSSLLMAINVIDNESGTLSKRNGSETYLDNPDGEPVTALIEYTNNSDITMQIRVSGNNIYVYRYQGSSWNTPIPAPTYLMGQIATSGTVGANLAPSTTYYYIITSLNLLGETTGSSEFSITTGATAYPITLFWYGSPTASSYNVYRGTTSGGEVLLGNVPATLVSGQNVYNCNNSFTDNGDYAPGTQTVPTTNTAVGSQYTLVGKNLRMRYARLNGFLFLGNGVDPYMYFDGEYFYQIENNIVSTQLTDPVFSGYGTLQNTVQVGATSINIDVNIMGTSQTGAITLNPGTTPNNPNSTTETVEVSSWTGSGPYTLTISATQFAHSGGESILNPSLPDQTTFNVTTTQGWQKDGGFFIINASSQGQTTEVILYGGITETSFIDCQRGYNNTQISSYAAGDTVNVYYGAPPITPSYLYQWNNRVFAANLGSPNGGSLLQWSAARGDVSDGYNYQVTTQSTYQNGLATGTLDESLSYQHALQSSDGEPITGLEVQGKNLIAFKKQPAFLMTSDNYGVPNVFDPLTSEFGTFSQESVTHLSQTTYWYNNVGIQYSTGTDARLLSRNIEDLVLGVPEENLPFIVGVKHNYVLYFFVGSTTESYVYGGETYENVAFVYNQLTSHWFVYQYPFTVNAAAELYDSSDVLRLYMGDTAGNTYVRSEGPNPIFSDGGEDMAVLIETRNFYFKKAEKRKNYTKISCFTYYGQNATLYASVEQDDIQTNWIPIMDLPQLNNRRDMPKELGISGRGIKYKITESSSGAFRLKGIVQEFELQS